MLGNVLMISIGMLKCSAQHFDCTVNTYISSFLSSCGVDGVKADVQCSLDELDNSADRQRIGRAYQDAFKLASLKHFSRNVIYCMYFMYPVYPELMTH